jgi:hypothetical protein
MELEEDGGLNTIVERNFTAIQEIWGLESR